MQKYNYFLNQYDHIFPETMKSKNKIVCHQSHEARMSIVAPGLKLFYETRFSKTFHHPPENIVIKILNCKNFPVEMTLQRNLFWT